LDLFVATAVDNVRCAVAEHGRQAGGQHHGWSGHIATPLWNATSHKKGHDTTLQLYCLF
jgi:hypothetical protein